MQYTETQLAQLIANVEKEFNTHLDLAKSEDGDKKPPEKEPEEKEAKPKEAAPEAKPEAEAKPAEAPAAAPEAEAKPAEAAPAAAPAAAAPAHDYDNEDLEHLHKMYMSMSEGERKVHHDAIMKCASMAKCGDVAPEAAPHGAAGQQAPDSHSHPDVQKSELNAHPENAPAPKVKGENLDSDPKNGGIEGQQPANALGPKSPASKADGVQMGKSEHARRNGGKIEEQAPNNSPGAKSPASKEQGSASMEKSELGTETELLKSELSSVNAKYEELKKTFDTVAAVLTKMVERKAAPAQKAVVSLDVIAKSELTGEGEPLKKEEIDSKLLAKSQDPKTSKADRDAINAFYLSNQDIKGISHLLK